MGMVSQSNSPEPFKGRTGAIPEGMMRTFVSMANALEIAIKTTDYSVSEIENELSRVSDTFDISQIDITSEGVFSSYETPTPEELNRLGRLEIQKSELIECVTVWSRFIGLQKSGQYNTDNLDRLVMSEGIIESMFEDARRYIIKDQIQLLNDFENSQAYLNPFEYKEQVQDLLNKISTTTYKLGQIQIATRNLEKDLPAMHALCSK